VETKSSLEQATALVVREALRDGMARLREAQVPSHTLAAELLLMHALGRDRTWLYSHPEVLLAPGQVETYFALIARRSTGEPTQYLTGKQEFWGLEFEVNRDVLIPRPETEHVVEVALERIRKGGIGNAHLRIADVGTGSGCIAVALARELPDAEIFATDISAAALEVARRNAARHGVTARIHFLECDLLQGVACSSLDMVVSNPPYVAGREADALAREVREHEPHLALFGGAAGTEIYARLIEQASALLRPGGILVLELGYDSAAHVEALLGDDPAWTDVAITNDLAGIPRVIAARKI
jgi:release factor glutamine methyltransferase